MSKTHIPTIHVKENDTQPLRMQLLDFDGGPLDLSEPGTTVKFLMAETPGGTTKVNADGAILDGAQGIVEYAWVAGDLDTPDTYKGEWEITYGVTGKVQTVPDSDYFPVRVLTEIG